MKKNTKRAFAGVSIVLMTAISGIITLVFFPQSLFAHKIEHGRFNVYFDTEIDESSLRQILDNSYSLIESCELHDKDYQFNVFLAYGNIFNRIENLQGKGPIARATAGNITFKVPLDFKNNTTLSTRSKVNLTELLAHEMIHNLQASKFGYENFNPIQHPPLWKLEGYPEYVSRQTRLSGEGYSLKAEIDRFVRLNKESSDGVVEVVEEHFMPTYYYKGRLMVEYLMDVKGLTYDQIMSDKRSESAVFKEMVDWSKSK